jgi:ligand-binding sensor domain-containing protein
LITPLFLILFLLLSNSCEKDDPLIIENDPLTPKEDVLKEYSPVVSFDITSRLLEGKRIDCIEPNYKGITWIASGNELYYLNDSVEKKYTLDYPIFDISIAGDETLWIATDGGGLGHLSEEKVKWFNQANSGLPRDYIRNVEVGLDGRVWFSSGAHDRGGLLVYDGSSFDLFTPDNSMLNQHVIGDIGIDHSGSIYINTSGKVGKSNVYRISDDTWACLGDENGTFYWIWIFSVGPAGMNYLIEDFTLSSSIPRANTIHEFRNDAWNKLDADVMSWNAFFTTMKADRRNYCWLAGMEGSSRVLHVYNGTSWEEAPEGLFFGDKITTIETDMDNNIWVGTSQNGVFILKQ